LPEFLIRFLTEPGDLVVDIFGGSGTTGEAAELLGRRWKSIDLDLNYVKGAVFRFVNDRSTDDVRALLESIEANESPKIEPPQPQLL